MTEYEHCPVCHKKLPENLQVNFCPFCGVTLIDHPTEPSAEEIVRKSAQERAEEIPAPELLAWESEGGELSFLQKLTQAWTESIFHPADFFRKVRQGGKRGTGKAFLYAIIFIIVGQAFSVFWQKVLLTQMQQQFQDLPPIFQEMLHPSLEAQLIYAPIFGLLGLVLLTFIYHISLMILGAANNGMEATFKVVAYAQGTSLFVAFPILGWIMNWIWGIVLLVIGFRETQETSTEKAIFALLLPLLVCCILPLIAVLMFGSLFTNLSQP